MDRELRVAPCERGDLVSDHLGQDVRLDIGPRTCLEPAQQE